jgi:hypothetical protein
LQLHDLIELSLALFHSCKSRAVDERAQGSTR